MRDEDWQAQLNRLESATLSVAQAADYLGITPRAVNRLLERERLSRLRFKDRTMIPLAAVEAYRRWKLYRSRSYTMGLFATENLYTGINPHLMSLYQTPGWGGFKGFHSDHITDLKRFIRRLLPEGYAAYTEDMLSILRGPNVLPQHHQTDVFRFGINQPIPTIALPLLASESVVCDFDAVYQYTFNEGFAGEVDYNLEPLRMETYSAADQSRIYQHIQQLIESGPPQLE